MNPDDKRLRNLKPFPKGVSGNPAGPRRRKPLIDALLAELEALAPGGTSTNLEVGISTLMAQWRAGDPHAQKLLFTYIEGMPTQRIDVRGEAQRLAEQYGLDVDELLRDAEAIMAGARRSGQEP